MALNLLFYTHNFLTCRSDTELVDPKWIPILDARKTKECIYSQAFPPNDPHHDKGRQNHIFIVFEAICHIQKEDFNLTTTGDAITGDPEAEIEPYAYCWLEAPTETGPLKWEWDQLMAWLNSIVCATEEKYSERVNTEFLFDGDGGDAGANSEGSSGDLKYLQVNFKLHHLVDKHFHGNDMPLFDIDGKHCISSSVNDIPIERPICAFFTLLIWPPPSSSLTVAASIQSIHLFE
ncbi:hypothetical protein EWM64_g3384 [Hericium alpestre]|uniref:Uncharacterized protein n=1 Tax=Hericium alpestre TaxID=135208 RepID=A0A4Z0A2D8_9AGAM|nr:hypothetical protein EWM64_g3384 [Hericium alpestre]